MDLIKRIARTAPRLRARVAGILYLAIFIAAPSGAADATPAKMAITLVCDTGVALLLYNLLKPVGKKLALVAAIFRLIFVAVMAVNSMNYFGLLDLYKSAHSAASFNSLYGISLAPFGVHCVLTGYLIFHSKYLPRTIGILFALAGLGYLVFLWPSVGDRLFVPYIVIPGVVGEGSLTLWLIIMGLNSERWSEAVQHQRS